MNPVDILEQEIKNKQTMNISHSITCLGIAFHLLSYYEEDCSHEAQVVIHGDRDEIILIDYSGCCEESVEAFNRSFGKIIGVPYQNCNIKCSNEFEAEGKRYGEITREIAHLFLKGFQNILSDLALTGYEYFLLIGWNGEVAYGKGEREKIHLPLIPGIVMAHTHPSPYCYPSGHDLVSAADFFSIGGLVEAIISTNCSSVMRLTKPLDENDYWELMKLGDRVKHERDYEEYIATLNKILEIRSIAFEVY